MKRILLGVTGGIAAYKAAEIASYFSKKYSVSVIMTKNATEFITPLTFEALTGKKTHVNQFDDGIAHITLAKENDIMLIAPATANVIAKISNGIADDLLTSTVLAFTGKILIAPAMNTNMYLNPMTQENIQKLKNMSDRFLIIDPKEGLLACKDKGIGKLANVEDIQNILELEIGKLDHEPKDKKVLVVSGPTTEKLDSVRVLTNISSGKMGNALFKAFSEFGYDTDIYKTNGKSALEVFEDIKKIKDNFNIVIMAAAISDISVEGDKNKKIKKNELIKDGHLTLKFKENPDILKYLGENKKEGQIIIGFAAETNNIFEFAKKKLEEKKANYIILNDVSDSNIGFNSDYNEVYVISDNNKVKIERDTKENIAKQIVKVIEKGRD